MTDLALAILASAAIYYFFVMRSSWTSWTRNRRLAHKAGAGLVVLIAATMPGFSPFIVGALAFYALVFQK